MLSLSCDELKERFSAFDNLSTGHMEEQKDIDLYYHFLCESSFSCLLQVVRSNGESLLHLLAREGLEEAGLFLTTQGVNCNVVNADGETPLHVSCTVGLPSLTTALLQVRHHVLYRLHWVSVCRGSY